MIRRSFRPAADPDAGLARLAVAGLAAVVVVVLGGTAAALLHSGSSTSASPRLPGGGTSQHPSPAAKAAVLLPATGVVPWAKPITLSVLDGTLENVVATGAGGHEIPGTLTPTGWTSATTLVPEHSYSVQATVKDSDGHKRTLSRTYTAAAPSTVLHATISPGNGAVVGVAQPVIVRFDQKVFGAANRSAVLRHLKVTTTPAVAGAWRWYNSFEVHWRPAHFFASGTKVQVDAKLELVHLDGTGTWGSTTAKTRTFAIGKDYESTVDIAKHVMVVRLDGKVIKTIKVSTGRDKYPTKGGVHIVLTREKVHTYNSGTVGIPTDGPGGYYEKLPWSMRISNGGAFVHANPATVGVQGVRNVSHGCVNTSVADAEWFYNHSQIGDPVNIINAVVKPVLSDAGMYDWNIPFSDWEKGNLGT